MRCILSVQKQSGAANPVFPSPVMFGASTFLFFILSKSRDLVQRNMKRRSRVAIFAPEARCGIQA